jgi:AmmeMemoRadiSam system protein B
MTAAHRDAGAGGGGSPRLPAVAGTFYPSRPDALAELVAACFDQASAVRRPEGAQGDTVRGLLVPHAGLVYSGAIAALGWSLACEMGPATIVVAGTDHQAWAAGIGVWTGGPWRIPGAEIGVDTGLARRIAALGKPFDADDSAHLNEHSIEVQLPLLAHACPGAMIVPLAVSPMLEAHEEAGTLLGRLLAELREGGERILLVISSDFAHYPPADVCASATRDLMEPMSRLDSGGLAALEARLIASRPPGLACGMCGIDPTRFGMAALSEMGATHGLLLGAATSADAGGDSRRTVGYAAVAFV